MTLTSIQHLEFIEPRTNSDKFYRVFLDHETNEVLTQYGRNGTFGTFTKRKQYPTAEKAQAEFDKAVTKKVAKGYATTRRGEVEFEGAPTDSSLDAAAQRLPESSDDGVKVATEPVVTFKGSTFTADPAVLNGIQRPRNATRTTANPVPMLAANIASSDWDLGQLIRSRQWVMQLKLDGERALIEVDNGEVSVYNRQGQAKVRNIDESMLTPFRHLTEGYWLFDGEILGRELWLFDMPVAEGIHDEFHPFMNRNENLHSIYNVLSTTLGEGVTANIRLVETAVTSAEKKEMFDSALRDNREGVILRFAPSPYRHAKRSLDLLKCKFVKEVDAFVTEVGKAGKENVVLAVMSGDDEQTIGQASTIGKGSINVGDVVEVAYLYVVDPDNPRLYQPRILRTRTDKSASECVIAQLANAATNKSVD